MDTLLVAGQSTPTPPNTFSTNISLECQTYLLIAFLCKAETPRSNVPNSWAAQDTHDFSGTASIVRYWQHMRHTVGEVLEVRCNAVECSSPAEDNDARGWCQVTVLGQQARLTRLP